MIWPPVVCSRFSVTFCKPKIIWIAAQLFVAFIRNQKIVFESQATAAGTQVFYGTGASANATKIADYFGATAAALTSLPAGHVEVLLGQQVIAPPPGLESFGATTVTEQDFVAAAQQNNLPASELPPATAAGTQSVSATEVGARAVAPVRAAAPARAFPSELFSSVTRVVWTASSSR